jgi:hypothetical protein
MRKYKNSYDPQNISFTVCVLLSLVPYYGIVVNYSESSATYAGNSNAYRRDFFDQIEMRFLIQSL